MRLIRQLVLAGATVALATSCSTSTTDYRREAEKFLESDELAEEAGYRFSDAVCEAPGSTTEGAQFTCAATDNDGDQWEFTVEVTGDREITVVSGDVVGSVTP